MTTRTTRPRSLATTPGSEPKPRRFGPPDPGMRAPLITGQNTNVRYLLTSGWYMHEAAHGNGEAWWEMSEILDDLGLAWDRAFAAERVSGA